MNNHKLVKEVAVHDRRSAVEEVTTDFHAPTDWSKIATRFRVFVFPDMPSKIHFLQMPSSIPPIRETKDEKVDNSGFETFFQKLKPDQLKQSGEMVC